MRIAEDILNTQKTEADKKRKQAQDQAQAIGNPNLLEDEQSYDASELRPQHVTN